MRIRLKKTDNNRLLLLSLMIVMFLYQYISYAGDTTVKTPEGRSVPADTPDEMSQDQINDCHSYIQNNYIDSPPYLNAVRIGSASNTYNCHGYAWSKSEGGDIVWIGTYEDPDVETYYWNDGSYSNDSQSSYLTASESEATHAWYNPGDHSVRKIQNSYPRAITGGRDYVSKWAYFGLYQHAKGHDIFRLKSTSGFEFKKLKTTHTGTLSSYPKTWVGAGGKIHSISNDVTVSSGNSLKILEDASVEFDASKSLKIYGTLKAEGTSGNMITFDKSGVSKWGGIRFYDSSDDSECILSYCTLSNASSYLIYCTYANPTIENCTLSNATSIAIH